MTYHAKTDRFAPEKVGFRAGQFWDGSESYVGYGFARVTILNLGLKF
jgi:hypothetical protein